MRANMLPGKLAAASVVLLGFVLLVATPATAQSRGEVITPNFEHAILNIPSKSLVAVVVDHAPGGASILTARP